MKETTKQSYSGVNCLRLHLEHVPNHNSNLNTHVCVFVCVLCPSQLRLKFHKQQEDIRRLRELLNQRDVRIKQMELEIKNLRNSQQASL